MIVEMRTRASQKEIDSVVDRARSLNLDVQMNLGTDKTVVAILGSNTGQLSTDVFGVLPGVERVSRIMKPYKLASREFKPKNSIVSIDGIDIGGKRLVIMAGPCAVESEQQLLDAARTIKKSGFHSAAVPSNRGRPPSASGLRRPAWSFWREPRSKSACR
jgi:3-deoxy-7-phosphoheptulonate synthase